jgi:hypothetical protein
MVNIQGEQVILQKKRPKCGLREFSLKKYITFSIKKVAQKLGIIWVFSYDNQIKQSLKVRKIAQSGHPVHVAY